MIYIYMHKNVFLYHLYMLLFGPVREDFMASFGPLTSEDVFADLGSGRGGVLMQDCKT